MAILPVDIRDILYTGDRVRKEREQPVRVAVFVDIDAPDVLIDAFHVALTPATANARVHVEVVRPGELLVPDAMADVVIALGGSGTNLVNSLRASREQLLPTVAVVLEDEREAVARRLQHPVLDIVADPQSDDAVAKAGRWIVDHVEGKKIPLAANFAFMRKAVAEESVKNTSMQNGLIGGVLFIPGADMPVMTANQAKMIMQIAGVYGQPLGPERVKELAAVVGGGFALRAVARSLVGLIPGFGWAWKAAIGYSGTWAMGKAAIEYFENGGTVAGVVQRVAEVRQETLESAARTQRKDRGKIAGGDYVLSEEGELVELDEIVEVRADVIDVEALPAGPSTSGDAAS